MNMDSNAQIDLLFTLYFVGRKVKSEYRHRNEDKMLDAAILHLLHKRAYTLSELAKKLYSKLSSVSEKLTQMEKEGYIMRKDKKDDEREIEITLSTKGIGYVHKNTYILRQHCVQFMHKMTKEDVVVVNRLMQKLLI